MKFKFFFLFGFLLVVGGILFWQKQAIILLFLALKGERQILTPLAQLPSDENEPKVLGEITTLESDFDLGKILTEDKVLAEGAYAADFDSGKIIFEKDGQKRLQAASTVKILTAAVALDRGKLDEEMTVNYFPTVVGESSMNLAFGERFSLEELLYGLLLTSGNDAAETIAQGLGGKRETFVGWMNDAATKLGAKNTHFSTPSGLDKNGQYTTAYDLFLIGREVFSRYPKIVEVLATREKYLAKNSGHRTYLLRNKLMLLDIFPGLIAGKPGLGEQGMLSLVTVLEKNQHRFLVALIRTPSLRHDLTQILKII